MKDEKDYYLTTAITYTSGKPHIGNTYEIILADSKQEQTNMDKKLKLKLKKQELNQSNM